MSKIKFDWENPEVIKRNKEDGHVLAIHYDSATEAAAREPSPYKKTLNGDWKFYWQMGLDNAPADFYKVDFDDSKWRTIPVPSVWQTEKTGSFPYYYASTYCRAISRQKGKIPSIDHNMQEIGIYRRTFTLPENYSDKELFLHFGAAKSAIEVYLNGKYVGYSQGSMTPHEFDITPYVTDGKNQVSVKCYRYSDAQYLEDQDMWLLCGIYREVYLYAEPKVCLRDFFITTDLDENYVNSDTNLEVTVKNYTDKEHTASVYAFIERENEKTDLGTAETVIKGDTAKVNISKLIENPLKWTAETPNLYTLVIELTVDGEVVSYKSIRFGFKKVEIVGEHILFNGQKLMLRGINRHDFDPDHGWAVPKERYFQDLNIMKRCNINAIRTSHYPDDPFLYELCDEYGFYVMDECDMETHGVRRKGVPGSNPMWTEAVVDKMERMVLRDRNHACIFMWSLGNEAGDGDNFLKMKQAAKKLDGTRQFHYEGDFDFTKSDVISRMYPMADLMEKMGKREEVTISLYDNIANQLAADSKPIPKEAYTKPVLLCEYAHAMENSLGNFQEYMDDFEKYDNMCGGFIWDFVDQAIRYKAPDGDHWLYGTDFEKNEPRRPMQLPNTTAITGSNTYFCANGIISADRKLHPSSYEVKKVYAEMKVKEVDAEKQIYSITNKHLFTDLSDFDIVWVLNAEGETIQSGKLDVNVPAQSTAEVKIPYDVSLLPEKECVLIVSFLQKNEKVFCEKGFEQAFDQFIIKAMPEIKDNPQGRLDYKFSGNKVTVTGEDFAIRVIDGKISSIEYNGREYLKTPLKPNYFRAVTDNDLSITNFLPFLIPHHPYYKWKKATDSMKGTVTGVEQGESGEIIIHVAWQVMQFTDVRSDITVYPDGKVRVYHEGTPKAILLKFGTQMGLIRDLDRVKWYGRGPQETYSDRKTGGKIGIYEMSVDELEHHYMRPQENGNRTDIRYVEITDKNGEGLRFTAPYNEPLMFSAWHYTQNELDEAAHIHELKHKDITTFNFDLTQIGVGGDMPGDAKVREPYVLHPNRKYAYSFTIEKKG